MDQIIETLQRLATTYGIQVIGGLVILIVGWIVASWSARSLHKALSRMKRVDPTLAGFFSSLLKYTILAIVIFAVLNQFGVQVASLLAVFGAAGLAVGLALQGTLSNLAAGVMLLLFRPFKIGDYIETGAATGTVKSLNLFTTELATPDNVQIVAPNGKIWGDTIKNYSFHPTRRCDFLLSIGYGDNIDKAIQVIEEVVANDPRAHKDPAPQIVVGELGDSAVNIIVRAWCSAADYWQLRFDLTKAFKEAFDKAGISIPFPHQEVIMRQAPAA